MCQYHAVAEKVQSKPPCALRTLILRRLGLANPKAILTCQRSGAISPKANNRHGKRQPRKRRLNTLIELLPLHRLPNLLAIHIIALRLELHSRPLLIAALSPRYRVIDAGSRYEREDGCVEQVRMSESSRRD
jgi:hypothetical protein